MTEQPKHTKGPWRREGPDEFGDWNILPPHEAAAVAAVVSNLRPPEEVEANAAIVAAATEIFDALQAIIDWCDLAIAHRSEFDAHGVRNLSGPAFDRAREALDKARGTPPAAPIEPGGAAARQRITDLHNLTAGRIVASIVRPTLNAGGSLEDVLVLTESVLVGVALATIRLGGDNRVLDVLVQGAKERLAEIRLRPLTPKGTA